MSNIKFSVCSERGGRILLRVKLAKCCHKSNENEIAQRKSFCFSLESLSSQMCVQTLQKSPRARDAHLAKYCYNPGGLLLSAEKVLIVASMKNKVDSASPSINFVKKNSKGITFLQI